TVWPFKPKKWPLRSEELKKQEYLRSDRVNACAVRPPRKEFCMCPSGRLNDDESRAASGILSRNERKSALYSHCVIC
ncbi:hypothetical protein M9458_043195, partial [Cirrhinus mrigala]